MPPPRTHDRRAGGTRRPRQRNPWLKVVGLRAEQVTRRRFEGPVPDVELDGQVVSLAHRRVVLVTETVIERQGTPEPPFVLAERNRVLLLRLSLAGRAVVEDAGLAE